MCKFIYVFKKDIRDELLSCGYTLIKSDDLKNIYVFENTNNICFSLNKSDYVYSDTMTF